MDRPVISVYMPTCNRRDLLERAVKSVQAQTFTDYELLIVDDGSTDGTQEYLKGLMASDPRVRCFFKTKSEGACAARNLAIDNARGKYITGLDDDDEFLPQRLDILLKSYKADCAFVCHGFIWQYGLAGRAVDTRAMTIDSAHILSYNHATNQVFTETEKLRAIGGFDTNFPAFQDYDTWTRLVTEFGAGIRVDGASYIIHQGHDGPRITSQERKRLGHAQYQQQHGHLMSRCNRLNQEFLACVIERKPLSIRLFVALIGNQFRSQMWRYFISSHLSSLALLRQRLLHRGLK